MLGSAIFVSAFVVQVRKKAFENKFAVVVERNRRRREAAKGTVHRKSRSLVRHLTMSFARTDNKVGVPGTIIQPSEGRDLTDATTQEKVPDRVNNLDNDDIDSIRQPRSNTPDLQTQSSSQTATDGFRGRSLTTEPQAKYFDQAQEKIGTDDPDAGDPDLSLDQSNTSNPAGPFRRANGDNIPNASEDAVVDDASAPDHITFGPNTLFRTFPAESSTQRPPHRRFISMTGIGAHSNASIKVRSNSHSSVRPEISPETFGVRARKYLPFASPDHVARNSQFHGLSDAEREHLGGCEYRAIQLLAWLVPLYFVLFQFFGCLGLGAYVANNKRSVTESNGLNPWWVGSFNAVSAFNNSGMSLLDANMVAFQTSIYTLITMSLLILAGNTCYPIFLRLIIWTFYKLTPKNES